MSNIGVFRIYIKIESPNDMVDEAQTQKAARMGGLFEEL